MMHPSSSGKIIPNVPHGTAPVNHNNDVIISAVVCTYNRSHILSSCLESLVNQSLDKNFYEIIVVNNNSVDSTDDIVRDYSIKYPSIRMLDEKRQGLSHARNLGYIEARGEYIAYLDDDAKADKNWLANILKAFESLSPIPAAVGGKVLPYYLCMKPDWFLDEYEVRSWGEKAHFLKPRQAKFGFSGSNMAFQKRILQKFFGFSPGFGMTGGHLGLSEETELFYRISQETSYFWYDPEIIVEHLVPEFKMKLDYMVKRIFRGAICIHKIRLGRERSYSYFVTLNIAKIIFYSLMLFFTVENTGKHWQNKFLHYTSPLAGACGGIIGLLEAKYGVDLFDWK